MALAGRAGIGGDIRHEQGLSTLALRGFAGTRRTFSYRPSASPAIGSARGLEDAVLGEMGHDRVEVVLVKRHERLGRFRGVTVSSSHAAPSEGTVALRRWLQR
jgi:hypothetical protein